MKVAQDNFTTFLTSAVTENTIVKSFGSTGTGLYANKSANRNVVIRKLGGDIYSVNVNTNSDNMNSVKLQIFAANGANKLTKRIGNRGISTVVLNKKDFASGIYILSLSGKKYQYSKKIIFN